jgi:hypothetical protein
LQDYKAKRDTADARIKQIRESYGEEAAQREAERQNKALKQARAAAEEAIRAAHGEGRRAAENWGKLDGSKLTDDIKLLDAGLVDREAFRDLKERYKDNSSMLAALKKYADKQNAAAMKEAHEKGDLPLAEPYETRGIPTAEGKAKSWDRARDSALDMLDAMDGTGKYSNPHDWGASFVKAAMPQTLESFGDNL